MEGFLYDVCSWGVTVGLPDGNGGIVMEEWVIPETHDSWDEIIFSIRVNELKIPDRYKAWWSKHE